MNTYLPAMNKNSRKVWCYKHADFTTARQLILDVDSLLINDINIARAGTRLFVEVKKKGIPIEDSYLWINKN